MCGEKAMIPQEVQDKLEDYLDQSLSREDYEELVSWATQSDANGKELVDWFVWHAQLRDVTQVEGLKQVLPAHIAFADVCEAAESNSSTTGKDSPVAGRGKATLARSFVGWGIAASLALMAGLGLWHYNSSMMEDAKLAGVGETQGEDEGIDILEPSYDESIDEPIIPTVAYLGRNSDCTWLSEQLTEGDPLLADSRVSLDSGMAELIFDSGARVSLFGPCDLQIEGPDSFSLKVGDVSVEASFGFQVTTPSGTVIDLGTAFGVSVTEAGESEVHVFEGEVVFRAHDASGAKHGESILLREEQACRYSVGGVSLVEFQANESKFAWRERESISDDDAPELPVRDGLALWLAADRYVETDDLGRVICWRDILVSPNRTAEDALQPIAKYRPVWNDNGINGRPSVVFGGLGTFLLTPPLHTTNEQTAFVVCSLAGEKPSFQPILNYNGPPQRIPGAKGGPVSPGVFQIFADDGDGDGRFRICGHVFSGFSEGRRNAIVETVADDNRLIVGHPLVIAFQHAPDSQQLSLYVNSEQVGTLTANLDVAVTSRKIIGRHPVLERKSLVFRGGLGEIIVFNRALPSEEIMQVSDYLRQRFGI